MSLFLLIKLAHLILKERERERGEREKEEREKEEREKEERERWVGGEGEKKVRGKRKKVGKE